ncbi:MAG: adenosylcobalamin-dependent ribonucleoside-diphosphate reductase [Candidatus Nanoarchaeia archaeon]
MQEMKTKILQKNTLDVKIVEELQQKKIPLSQQAKNILNNSTHLKEMGLIIFLDRYAKKTIANKIGIGDVVVAISKDHPKYPKKDLGIITKQQGNIVQVYFITGAFKDDTQAIDILKCDKPEESIYDAYCRVARAVASVEGIKKDEYAQKFTQALLKGYIQPAGRIMAGANVDEKGNYTSNLTLYNCFVIPSPKDSRRSIVQDTLFELVEIMSRGGGVGINLSSLRPRYARVKGVNGKSSGAVSWGNLYSNATGLIEQGGSRRGALMLALADWHPDIEEFIASKHKIGFLDNANISVFVSNQFMEAVKTGSDWSLEYPDIEDPETKKLYDEYWDGNLWRWKKNGRKTKVYKTIKARKLWHELIGSAWKSAEPGIIFSGRYNDQSNSYYYNDIVCTNPCGEQGLPPWGVCNLGHLALNNFLYKTGEDNIGPIYDFDWEELKQSAQLLVRFLDDVIDLTPYIFEENEKNQKSERRVGCGTLGLAEVLLRMRIPFGSQESLEFMDKLYKTITSEAYSMSADLAEEKGSFPYYDGEKFLKSQFVQRLPQHVQEKIKEKGMRNVSLTTQAPTGTVGSMLGTSTGIEPFFAFKYFQQSRLGFHEVDIDIVKDYVKKEDGSLQDFFVGAMDLGPQQHVQVQAAIQKWTDSSISKTANVPANFTVDDTMQLYELAYDLGCKGMTIYRDGSRDEQILSTDKNTGEKNLEDKGSGQAVPSSVEDSKNDIKEESSQEVLKKPADTTTHTQDVVCGSEIGNTCPVCKKGKMVKLGGCTECSAGCGFKGGCDMK